MKKSKKINLVVLTAILASCNRSMIPIQQPIAASYDSSLTISPSPGDSTYNLAFIPCSCQIEKYNKQITGQDFYMAPMNEAYYSPTKWQQRQSTWIGKSFVVKGGFGQTGNSVSS